MRPSTFCADFFPQSFIASLEQTFSSKCGFIDRSLQLGLNPASDFRYADLRGCDFSNCDLRHFDFTGADLRYVFGLNVTWDETTKIGAASVDESFFASETETIEEEKQNPEWEKDYIKISQEDAEGGLSSIVRIFESDSQDNKKALYIVKKMYLNTKSTVVRNNMLYCMSAYGRRSVQIKHFLNYLISNSNTTITSFRSAIRVLSEAFSHDQSVSQTFLVCLESADDEVRAAAIRGLMKAPDFPRTAPLLCQKMGNEPRLSTRRLFLSGLSKRMGLFHFLSSSGLAIDYLEPLSPDDILALAANAATHKVRQKLKADNDPFYMDARANLSEANALLSVVHKIIAQLQALGLPIVITKARPERLGQRQSAA